MQTPESLMRLALDTARSGVAKGQSPFGCVIARGDEILASCHNLVLASNDITAHAEVNAIRAACRTTGSIFLEDCRVATTCEPCPMCLAALHWARVGTVYYGATIADASGAGFNELSISATEMVRRGNSPLQLQGEVLRDECRQLLSEWARRPDCQTY